MREHEHEYNKHDSESEGPIANVWLEDLVVRRVRALHWREDLIADNPDFGVYGRGHWPDV
ncbi:hypothetical protein CC2G_009661 [Coprinopsis cinerea AmutBmut pab1-1]|nr:hypothetical protein CC2G_009661 [Coprinopsis cinerea AmutBmut pab1-1]